MDATACGLCFGAEFVVHGNSQFPSAACTFQVARPASNTTSMLSKLTLISEGRMLR
jgi:hypothetical protein